jgi:uncharacterized protein YjbK
MKENLEIELKCLLNREQFECISHKMHFSLPVLQVNTYYDTENSELQKRLWMCRIREAKGRYEFTLKTPSSLGLNEFECLIERHNIQDSKIVDFFKKTGIFDPLYPIGVSKTYRRKYTDEYGEWCLDENDFDGYTDYEIEYELSGHREQAEIQFITLLKSCGIDYQQAKTKFERMLLYKKIVE